MSLSEMSSHVEQAAVDAAGNWLKFDSFAWHDKPDDAEDWTLVYTSSRDSGLLAESNEAAITKALEPFGDDVIAQHHGHWAVGHVDGFAVRVYDAEGGITAAFCELHRLAMALADYPLLDEEDHSRREYDAAIEAIGNTGSGMLADGAPDGWAGLVFSWLWDNDQQELETVDDQGAIPSDNSVCEALYYLGLAGREARHAIVREHAVDWATFRKIRAAFGEDRKVPR